MREFSFDIDNHIDDYIIAREDDIEIQINFLDDEYELIIEYLETDELIEQDFNNYYDLKEFTDKAHFKIPSEKEIFKMLNINIKG